MNDLDAAIINALHCYHALTPVRGGTREHFGDIPRRMTNLYTALDALETAYTTTRNSGGHIVGVTSHGDTP